MTDKVKRGFTLIELVVVIGIFGFLMVVAMQFLVSILQNSNRGTIQNDVRQNGAKLMADIVQEIRKSGCVVQTASGSLNLSDNGTGTDCTGGTRDVSYTVSPSTNPPNIQEGQVTKTVTTRNSSGTVTTSVVVTGSSVAVIDWNSCSTCQILPSCFVSGLTVTPVPNTSSWQINLLIQQFQGNRSDFCAKTQLTDTATMRQY